MADTFWTFLYQILVLLAAAMVLGTLCERMKQSAMVGYLLAGAVLGPDALNLVRDYNQVGVIAQLGVALLMFSIGLEFSWQKLRGLGTRTLMGGTLQIAGTLFVTGVVVMLLGQPFATAFSVGAIVALSSTAVVLPMLAARSQVDSVHGRFALGTLLLQDLAVIPLLLVVQSLVRSGSVLGILSQTGRSFLIVAVYAVVFALINRFVLPHVIAFGAAARNRDLTILFAIVVAAGSALVAHHAGFSPALGAFIAGIFLGESVVATQVRGDVGPLKTVFATLFFASIGMYLDPRFIAANAPAVAAVLVAVVMGKPLIIWICGRAVGLPHRYALAAGICMGQIGVFSFVLAQVALDDSREQAAISQWLFDLVINVTILSMFLTPSLTRVAIPIGGAIERILRRMGWSRMHTEVSTATSVAVEGHVIIIGYGPAGRAVADLLRAEHKQFVIIDLNPQTVLQARALGLPAYVGDAATSDVLTLAQVQNASAVVVTLPDHLAAMGAIRRTRAASNARVTARARYQRYVEDLETAGAHLVVNEEACVGQTLGQALLT